MMSGAAVPVPAERRRRSAGAVGLILRVIAVLLFASSAALNVILWRSRSSSAVVGDLVLLRPNGRTREGEASRKRGGNGRGDGKNARKQRLSNDDRQRRRRQNESNATTNEETGIVTRIAPALVRPTVYIGLGASDISKASRDVTQEDWQTAYELSLARFNGRSASEG